MGYIHLNNHWFVHSMNKIYLTNIRISYNKNSDKRLGKRFNCKPVKEDLGIWVEKQDIESIKRKFQEYTNVSDFI